MKEDWVLILSTKGDYQAKMAKRVLQKNGIESHIMHRSDSIYPILGVSTLYTPSEKAARAMRVLNTVNLRA